MFSEDPSYVGLQAGAVLAGAFLSGTMMSFSMVTVPVMLETHTQPSHLVKQFVRLAQYGVAIMPTLAMGISLLYSVIALLKGLSGCSWLPHLLPGLVTVSLVPFTMLFMTPIYVNVAQLDEKIKIKSSVELREVQGILKKWIMFHIIRSCFPAAGAILGGLSLLRELGY